MVVSQRFVRFTSSQLAQNSTFCDSVVANTSDLADLALSAMAQVHALVANPMTRYVRMESTRSPTRQCSDQGELRLRAY